MIELDKEFDYDKYNGSNLLDWFAVWYVKRAKKEKCLPMRTIQDNCIYMPPNSHAASSSVSGLTLYRQKDLQVQLYNLPPNSEIPLHVHPNMDSFEVYVGGDALFTVEGIDTEEHNRKIENFDHLEDKEEFYKEMFLRNFRVTETTSHGGRMGEKGGAWLSIQHWKNGVKPSSPIEDWEDS